MRLFSTDIDGTIYEGPESAEFFSQYWNQLCEQFSARPLLVFNTGRSVDHTMELVETGELPSPDYLICGVGTEIYDIANRTVLVAHSETLKKDWDAQVVYGVIRSHERIVLQPAKSQNPYKCSFFLNDATSSDIEAIVNGIDQRGVKAQAIYSSNRDLDFLPLGANKGNAIQWLADHLSIPVSEVIVAGDSGNDIRMFLVPDARGVVVENAEEKLRSVVEQADADTYFASQRSAWGVAEGIDHFLRKPS